MVATVVAGQQAPQRLPPLAGLDSQLRQYVTQGRDFQRLLGLVVSRDPAVQFRPGGTRQLRLCQRQHPGQLPVEERSHRQPAVREAQVPPHQSVFPEQPRLTEDQLHHGVLPCLDPHDVPIALRGQPLKVQSTDHAPVPHENGLLDVVLALQLPDDLGHRRLILSVARKDEVLQRVAFVGSHHPDHHLKLVRTLVTTEAELGQFAAVPIEEGRGDVIERQVDVHAEKVPQAREDRRFQRLLDLQHVVHAPVEVLHLSRQVRVALHGGIAGRFHPATGRQFAQRDDAAVKHHHLHVSLHRDGDPAVTPCHLLRHGFAEPETVPQGPPEDDAAMLKRAEHLDPVGAGILIQLEQPNQPVHHTADGLLAEALGITQGGDVLGRGAPFGVADRLADDQVLVGALLPGGGLDAGEHPPASPVVAGSWLILSPQILSHLLLAFKGPVTAFSHHGFRAIPTRPKLGTHRPGTV